MHTHIKLLFEAVANDKTAFFVQIVANYFKKTGCHYISLLMIEGISALCYGFEASCIIIRYYMSFEVSCVFDLVLNTFKG
mgnify:CR=1 FL=1|jgi:hypothetical protein